MTKIVAVLAVLLVALAGAYTGQAARSEGAIFTARITSVKESDGTVISLKQIRDRNGNVVGWGNTICTRLGNGSSQCMGTFVLPRGKVSVAGTRHGPAFFVLSITGGTGRYNGWSGTLIGRQIAYRTERLVFEAIAP